jgi:biotin carboxyl carrier protein
MIYDVTIENKSYRLEVEQREGKWRCLLDGREVAIDAVLARPDVLSILIGGKAYEVKRERTPTDTHYWVGSSRYSVELQDPRSLRSRRKAGEATSGPRKLTAPMPGRVVRVLAEEKSTVEAGQALLVIEAMKMQNEIKSPKNGVVQRILVQAGAAVNAGEVLAVVE